MAETTPQLFLLGHGNIRNIRNISKYTPILTNLQVDILNHFLFQASKQSPMFSLKASAMDILEYVKETKVKRIFFITLSLFILLFIRQPQPLPEMRTSKS